MRTFTIKRTGPCIEPHEESFSVENGKALDVTISLIARVAFDMGKWHKEFPIDTFLWSVSEEREGHLMSFRISITDDGGFILHGRTNEMTDWEAITTLE